MNEKIHFRQSIPVSHSQTNHPMVNTMKAQCHSRSSPLLQGITGRVASLGQFVKTGVLVLLLGSFAAGAHAQVIRAEEPAEPPRWTQAIGYQLAELLVSPIDEQRSQAFQLTAYYARSRPELDLEPTVPVLVEIYKGDAEERYRLAAVGALHAIGDENGMQQVRRLVYWQPSGRVQNVSLAALVDYYGPQTFKGDEVAAALAETQIERITAARQKTDKPVIAGRQ